MRISFSVRKDRGNRLGVLAAAHQLSLHKNHYKNWRSNQMYKSVKYAHCSLFGEWKTFARVNLIAATIFSLLLVFAAHEKHAIAKGGGKNNELRKQVQQRLAAGNDYDGKLYSTEGNSGTISDIPAFSSCFQAISF